MSETCVSYLVRCLSRASCPILPLRPPIFLPKALPLGQSGQACPSRQAPLVFMPSISVRGRLSTRSCVPSVVRPPSFLDRPESAKKEEREGPEAWRVGEPPARQAEQMEGGGGPAVARVVVVDGQGKRRGDPDTRYGAPSYLMSGHDRQRCISSHQTHCHFSFIDTQRALYFLYLIT